MTDIDTRISEIEARAGQATGTKWCVMPSYDEDSVYIETANDGGYFVAGLDADRPHDAEFIAHSREDIPWLISQLREQRSLCDRYREALEWYACEDTYMVQHNVRREEPEFVIASHDDRGARARAALHGDSNE